MNWKGLLLGLVGAFLIFMAVKGTYKDVWNALTRAKGAGSGGQ